MGLAPGTVASIILTLVLLVVLLVMCGPLIYKKLVKKFRQKKQRQWIGPTGVNQSSKCPQKRVCLSPGTQVNKAESRCLLIQQTSGC